MSIPPSAALPSIDVDQIASSPSADDIVLLDVREYEEWMSGHAPTARHIPMSQLPDRIAEVPLDARIVCICRSGNRSSRVTAWLTQQGFDAINMTGGMQQWANHGHPMVNHAGNAGVVL